MYQVFKLKAPDDQDIYLHQVYKVIKQITSQCTSPCAVYVGSMPMEFFFSFDGITIVFVNSVHQYTAHMSRFSKELTTWGPIQFTCIVTLMVWFGWFYGTECHFQQYFSYIVAVSFLGGGNQCPEKSNYYMITTTTARILSH